ncbi:hypothetical protein KXW60_008083, partial [Aspergillus fumigatus]
TQADHITDLDLRSSPGPKSALDRQWQQLGAAILQHIPGERDFSTLFSKHVNPNDGWIRLAAHHSSERMWNIFRPALIRRLTDDFLTLAAHISMRWETLGILFTYWAFGAISSSPESEPVSRYCQGHPFVMGPKKLMAHL